MKTLEELERLAGHKPTSTEDETRTRLDELYKRLTDGDDSGLASGDDVARRAAYRAEFAAVVADLGKR